MTNEGHQLLQLYWINLTCEFKRKNSFTLSKSCMKTEQFLLTVKSSFYSQWNIEELDHKAKEKLTSLRIRCGFLFKCLSSGWETVSRVTPRRNYSTQHKLLKPWSLPENEFSELWRTFINFSWLPLTLASSLDVEQVRFASWSVYRVLFENDLSNLSAVSVLSQKYNACTFRLQK